MSTRTVEKNCTRCGAKVAAIMSGPPEGRDRWMRYGVRITHREHVLRFSMFKRQWLPENPQDQVRETYTTLDLCDPCAGDVLLFAQGKPVPSGGAS